MLAQCASKELEERSQNSVLVEVEQPSRGVALCLAESSSEAVMAHYPCFRGVCASGLPAARASSVALLGPVLVEEIVGIGELHLLP